MPSLQTHNNSGRKKLVITKVEEKRKIGDAEVFEFFAKVEGEDSTVKYGVWSKSFYDSIKDGAVLDCDVVVKVSEKKDSEGNPYHNRKITQVYVDGQPVKSQQRQWGKSPETVAMEIDGKFRDTALMQARELANTLKYQPGILDPMVVVKDILIIADKFYAWLKGSPEKPAPESSGWHGKGTPSTSFLSPSGKEPVQPAQEKAALPVTESQAGTVDKDYVENILTTEIEELLKAVNWKPVTWRSWIKNQFKVDSTGELAEVIAQCNPNQVNMLVNHLKTMKESRGVK